MKTHHEEQFAEDDCEDEDDDSNDEWSGDSHEYQCSSKHACYAHIKMIYPKMAQLAPVMSVVSIQVKQQ
jgi:hypothetical protein